MLVSQLVELPSRKSRKIPDGNPGSFDVWGKRKAGPTMLGNRVRSAGQIVHERATLEVYQLDVP